MPRRAIDTNEAPKAIGPYAQAMVSSPGTMVFCSGQVPLDPASGELLGAGDIRAETDQVMKNLGAVLQAAGVSFEHVVKTTIYLTDLQNFAFVNEVYGSYFTDALPARATVEVSGLPKGAQVEIDAIAIGA